MLIYHYKSDSNFSFATKHLSKFIVNQQPFIGIKFSDIISFAPVAS